MNQKNKLGFICLLPFLLPFALSGITGYDIAKQMDDKKKPVDIKADLEMVLINNKGKKRISSIRSISADGGKNQIVWFLSPADDKGVAFLKIEHNEKDDEMKMWLPAFKKVRRISSRKKSDSFMGSDMSYEDMTSRNLDEYTYSITGSENINDKDCYILESTPIGIKTEYSKHSSWITKDAYLTLKEESFDKNGELLKNKTIVYQKIKEYHIMKKLHVKNVQHNHQTVLKFDNIEVDSGIEDNLFHEKNLKRMPK